MRFKQLFYKFANPIRQIYWFVFHPHTRGAKMLIEYKNQVLLIRNTYGRQVWSLPGGGVNKSESFAQAAIREAREEVGVNIKKSHYIGSYINTHEYKTDTVECYYSRVDSPDFEIDPGEILEAKWFNLTAIPSNSSRRLPEILTMRENYIKLHH